MSFKATVQQVCDFFSEEVKKQLGEVFAQGVHEKMVVHDVYTDSEGIQTVVFELFTARWMRNGHDIVHGGCIATIVDFYTTMALAGDRKYYENPNEADFQEVINVLKDMGVSRSLGVQFVKAVPIEQTVYIESKVVSNTKRNTYLTCKIKDAKGNVLVMGTHDKVKADPLNRSPSSKL